MNPFSHIDLRVTSFEKRLPFYEKLLPELGFTQTYHTQLWKVYATKDELPSAAYFAITEKPDHIPNDNLVGFWVKDREEVNRLAKVVEEAGGKITDGPRIFPFSSTYYSVFFEDADGNKFEIMHRLN